VEEKDVEVKFLEVRDAGTFMPVMAIKLGARSEEERWLLSRSGYGMEFDDQRKYVIVLRLAGGSGHSTCDPYEWPGPATTMPLAHKHIIENWDVLKSGDVVDVEYITGQTKECKVSERFTAP
jgi:hypothetical protein